MRNVVIPALALGIIGLVVGYFLFAKFGNGYIPVARLLGASHGIFGRIENALLSVQIIRRDILLSGLVGVVVGLVIGLGTRLRR